MVVGEVGLHVAFHGRLAELGTNDEGDQEGRDIDGGDLLSIVFNHTKLGRP